MTKFLIMHTRTLYTHATSCPPTKRHYIEMLNALLNCFFFFLFVFRFSQSQFRCSGKMWCVWVCGRCRNHNRCCIIIIICRKILFYWIELIRNTQFAKLIEPFINIIVCIVRSLLLICFSGGHSPQRAIILSCVRKTARWVGGQSEKKMRERLNAVKLVPVCTAISTHLLNKCNTFSRHVTAHWHSLTWWQSITVNWNWATSNIYHILNGFLIWL